MRKFLSIAVASLLITAGFASCGNSEKENTSSTDSQVSDSVVETTTALEEEATTEEMIEDVTEEQTDISEDVSETGISEAGDVPESETLAEIVPDEVAETDFIGKWECSKMVTELGEETEYAGVSIAKMIRFEVNSDNTAKMSSFMLDPEDEAGSLTWEYADNILTLSENSGDSYGKCAINNGELVVFDENNFMQIYFTKVDDFTFMTQEEQDKIYAQIESEGLELVDDTDSDESSETDITNSEE